MLDAVGALLAVLGEVGTASALLPPLALLTRVALLSWVALFATVIYQ
jgi:hypothetical protein